MRTTDDESVWIAPRKDGSGVYVALFNLSEEERRICALKEEIEIVGKEAFEIWSGERADPKEGISSMVQPHDAKVYFVKK